MQSYRHADPRRSPISNSNTWPLDLSVNACLQLAINCNSADFGVDSSSRFPFRRQTNRHTDRRKDTTERSTHAAAITSVDNKPGETIMGGPVDLWCGRTAVCLKTAALDRSLRPATEHFGPLFIANWQSATRICLHSPRDGRWRHYFRCKPGSRTPEARMYSCGTPASNTGPLFPAKYHVTAFLNLSERSILDYWCCFFSQLLQNCQNDLLSCF